jgi:hypothetical protein
MRLGKEQAAGFVEDTEADEPVAEESRAGQSARTPLTPVPEPAVPVV